MDGETGRLANLEESISFRDGLSRFLGLNSQELELLWELPIDRELSAKELAARTGVSSRVVRNRLRALEDRRLVRTSEVGKAKLYRRLVDPPDPKWRTAPLQLDRVAAQAPRAPKVLMKEGEVREVVKALWGESELESTTPFLYPLYRVELALKKKRRVVWVDGRTGKGVDA